MALKYQDYSLAQELLKGLESDKLESDELKLQVETNLAVTLSYLGDYENADQKFKKLSEMKSVKTQTLWSYAILAVEMKKDKALSQKVLDQIKSRAQDVRLLKKVKSLEERVKAL